MDAVDDSCVAAFSEEPCNWFSANSVHCLRSKYIHHHDPPCSFFTPGQEPIKRINSREQEEFHPVLMVCIGILNVVLVILVFVQHVVECFATAPQESTMQVNEKIGCFFSAKAAKATGEW